VLKQIRTPFFSTRKHEGCSGLGLAVVDNLVSSVLGGTMSISSEAGEGTTVTLTLPVQAPVPTV
jgi:two-component system NtrC family sensor kinase